MDNATTTATNIQHHHQQPQHSLPLYDGVPHNNINNIDNNFVIEASPHTTGSSLAVANACSSSYHSNDNAAMIATTSSDILTESEAHQQQYQSTPELRAVMVMDQGYHLYRPNWTVADATATAAATTTTTTPERRSTAVFPTERGGSIVEVAQSTTTSGIPTITPQPQRIPTFTSDESTFTCNDMNTNVRGIVQQPQQQGNEANTTSSLTPWAIPSSEILESLLEPPPRVSLFEDEEEGEEKEEIFSRPHETEEELNPLSGMPTYAATYADMNPSPATVLASGTSSSENLAPTAEFSSNWSPEQQQLNTNWAPTNVYEEDDLNALKRAAAYYEGGGHDTTTTSSSGVTRTPAPPLLGEDWETFYDRTGEYWNAVAVEAQTNRINSNNNNEMIDLEFCLQESRRLAREHYDQPAQNYDDSGVGVLVQNDVEAQSATVVEITDEFVHPADPLAYSAVRAQAVGTQPEHQQQQQQQRRRLDGHDSRQGQNKETSFYSERIGSYQGEMGVAATATPVDTGYMNDHHHHSSQAHATEVHDASFEQTAEATVIDSAPESKQAAQIMWQNNAEEAQVLQGSGGDDSYCHDEEDMMNQKPPARRDLGEQQAYYDSVERIHPPNNSIHNVENSRSDSEQGNQHHDSFAVADQLAEVVSIEEDVHPSELLEGNNTQAELLGAAFTLVAEPMMSSPTPSTTTRSDSAATATATPVILRAAPTTATNDGVMEPNDTVAAATPVETSSTIMVNSVGSPTAVAVTSTMAGATQDIRSTDEIDNELRTVYSPGIAACPVMMYSTSMGQPEEIATTAALGEATSTAVLASTSTSSSDEQHASVLVATAEANAGDNNNGGNQEQTATVVHPSAVLVEEPTSLSHEDEMNLSEVPSLVATKVDSVDEEEIDTARNDDEIAPLEGNRWMNTPCWGGNGSNTIFQVEPIAAGSIAPDSAHPHAATANEAANEAANGERGNSASDAPGSLHDSPERNRMSDGDRQATSTSATSHQSNNTSSSQGSTHLQFLSERTTQISSHLVRSTGNVMEVLFGDKPGRRSARSVSDMDWSSAVISRSLLPWSVIHSRSNKMWIATLQTNQKALDLKNVREASKALRAFSLPTEAQAICLAKAWTPPRMHPFADNPLCHICHAKFAVFRRPCHCRNCGVCVCKNCSVQWPSKMVPESYNIKKENTISACKSCEWLCNSFRLALLEGKFDEAVALHATGNVNLTCPFANIKGEEFFPVHCSVLGKNLQTLRWLVDEHCCPIKSVRVNGKANDKASRYTQIVTSKGRTLLGIAMEMESVDIVQYLVVKKGIAISGEKDITPGMLMRNLDKVLRLMPESSNTRMVNDIDENNYVDSLPSFEPPPEQSPSYNNEDFADQSIIIDIKSDNGLGDDEGGENYGVDDDDECIICFDNKIDCVATPCGHQICCLRCSKNISRCPVCAQDCSFLRVFKP